MSADRTAYLRRRAFALSKRYNLSRQERIEFAVAVTGSDVQSWTELSDAELSKLIIGMEAAAFMFKLLDDRKRAAAAFGRHGVQAERR